MCMVEFTGTEGQCAAPEQEFIKGSTEESQWNLFHPI